MFRHSYFNTIRIGEVSAIEPNNGLCRVATGDNLTTWLPWLVNRAGRVRTWSSPSIGEQVLVLSLGGELDTAFVLPGIFSDEFPAPSASADAIHISFPDGAVIEYEPLNGTLSVIGIKTANISAAESVTVTASKITCTASTRITLDTPEVVCTQKLTAQTIDIQQGGTISGNLTHSGGTLSSNGVVVHNHTHLGVHGPTGGPL
ncbi:phage baseplate assembly protein V [Sodalis ligni]|uniref:Phage baseplate assembly protein V n=1 Tax=Sodalis ligni TaxID=2697027 RepID=A0A4R1N902_9GAMM|nr:phage baseplate assembly protein V [Sodalis ligni]TCL03713.1 phage baseplate assembly protein V [Sodalis ligni]